MIVDLDEKERMKIQWNRTLRLRVSVVRQAFVVD